MSIFLKRYQLWVKINKNNKFNFFDFKMNAEGAPMSIDIGGMRIKYKDKSETFTEQDLSHKEPIGQFKTWFDNACSTPGILEANAMCLSTATKDGRPSSRYVLLKSYGKTGFKFFTNYESRKAQELTENPRAALLFYWEPLKRSVRIEGRVEKLPTSESDEYFHSRPFESQIGACVSRQSTVIASRDVLTNRERELKTEFNGTGKTLPRPECWGGYLVVPESVEFWQGQSDRLHDRIKFRRPGDRDSVDGSLLHEGEDGWAYERLSP